MRSAPTVSLEDSLGNVARLMITSGISQLPVFSGEKLAESLRMMLLFRGQLLGSGATPKSRM